jgi:hypothetical protein
MREKLRLAGYIIVIWILAMLAIYETGGFAALNGILIGLIYSGISVMYGILAFIDDVMETKHRKYTRWFWISLLPILIVVLHYLFLFLETS